MKLPQIRTLDALMYFTTLPCCLFALLLLLLPNSGWAAQRQNMHGHVPAAVANRRPISDVPDANHLNLTIELPLRNQHALTNLLQQIYDPSSTNYHHYLTPKQFTEMFGPTEKDYNDVVAFMKAKGLKVTAMHPNRMLVDVDARIVDIKRVFHTTIRNYQHPTEARTFYAPDVEPSLDLTTPILHIGGLDNYSLPRPCFVLKQATNATSLKIVSNAKSLDANKTASVNAQNVAPNVGLGPSGTYLGDDFRAAYIPGSSLTGSGQVVDLLAYEGYNASDITYYENLAGLPSVTLSNVLLDGVSGSPSNSSWQTEITLDIEMAISMAPGLSEIVVYEAPVGTWTDILNRMATDDLANQISASAFGGSASADQIFQEMALQGQSFFCASGDWETYNGPVGYPADNPYVTVVGGTTLTTSTNSSWASETVWNWGGGTGSGGGISTQYPIPSWQTNINMTTNLGSTTMRNSPDVALTADNICIVVGHVITVGGTSAASPLWAGFMALVNQQAAANSHAPVGFINPAIYAIGKGTNYTSCFHDITAGNNTNSASSNKYFAVPGYDLCTGWGTPNGTNLINALLVY